MENELGVSTVPLQESPGLFICGGGSFVQKASDELGAIGTQATVAPSSAGAHCADSAQGPPTGMDPWSALRQPRRQANVTSLLPTQEATMAFAWSRHWAPRLGT